MKQQEPVGMAPEQNAMLINILRVVATLYVVNMQEMKSGDTDHVTFVQFG